MAGQEATIHRLTHEVREKQEALEGRFGGSQIIGRGPAMRAMFATERSTIRDFCP